MRQREGFPGPTGEQKQNGLAGEMHVTSEAITASGFETRSTAKLLRDRAQVTPGLFAPNISDLDVRAFCRTEGPVHSK